MSSYGNRPMNATSDKRHAKPRQPLVAKISAKTGRKLKARRGNHPSLYFGLGMFGLVGWSVAIPTLAGIALGVWIDSRWPSGYSWTLMLLFMGIVLGCWNAWHWVKQARDDGENTRGKK